MSGSNQAQLTQQQTPIQHRLDKLSSIMNQPVVQLQRDFNIETRIQQVVRGNPGFPRWMIADMLGEKRKELRKHFNVMIKMGLLISKEGPGRKSARRLYLPGADVVSGAYIKTV